MPSRSIPFTYAQARLLAVLALINFVNFADRHVLDPLLPLLRNHFSVTDAQLGWLQTGLLIASRCMVGIGEAAYAPAAQAMISDSFCRENRAMAQAIFASGMLLGGAAGLALGGIMG